MSTRATVAEPHGDSWRGRHSHSDGYPTYRGAMLWRLVQRDGVDKVRQTIIHDYFGWSSIDADQQAEQLSRGYDDGRFVAVPGYGVAYTAPPVSEQSHETDWYGPHEAWGTADHEWAYVLCDSAMMVFRLPWEQEPMLVATVAYDGDEPDWSAIEHSAFGEVDA